jgi:phosphoenolpyruvate synthase/pyruvate phosphate dikinase
MLFGIDHRRVYPGVMIQIGVNATAAGVLITANLFNAEDEKSFTINAKTGLGIRVVEGTKVPEQIIFDLSNDGTKIISRSDDPVMLVFDDHGGIKEVPNTNNGVILTEERAKRLAKTVDSLIPLFSRSYPLDVEWLFEGEKVWIVQARPYMR